MPKNKTLSDEIENCYAEGFVWTSDLKKAIKRLKEINFGKRRFRIINDIDKIFGEKLTCN